MKFFLLSLSLLLITALPGISLAQSHGHAHSEKAAAPAVQAPWQAAAARYVLQQKADKGATQQQVWYFSRNAERISVLKPEFDDLWQRDTQGQTGFERAFHAAQRSVDYTAGELRTLNVATDWQALGRMIDPQLLATLKPVGTGREGGRQVQHYRGRQGADTVQLSWLVAEQLPARIERRRKGLHSILTLVELHATAPAHWPVPGQGSEAYARMDAADFGDMEGDPFVRKAEAIDVLIGWRSAHAHE